MGAPLNTGLSFVPGFSYVWIFLSLSRSRNLSCLSTSAAFLTLDGGMRTIRGFFPAVSCTALSYLLMKIVPDPLHIQTQIPDRFPEFSEKRLVEPGIQLSVAGQFIKKNG